MSTTAKVAGFLVAVAAVFGVALLVGRLVGPVAEPAVAAHDSEHDSEGDHGHEATGAATTDEVPGGLLVSQDGYTLALADTVVEAGASRPVSFSITGPDGEPVTEYDVEHEKDLHLIAVRRDFAGFQHVHPTLDVDTGAWSVDLDLTPGTWRLFADFTPAGGGALTLGADLEVEGRFQPAGPTDRGRTTTVGDYEVTLAGDVIAGSDARLTFDIRKDGTPVTDLQPYLGAYGHVVALREGDLAYLHVHPDGTPGDGTTKPGPDVTFYATVPSAGTYHLFLDFQHDGAVRTAAFTVTARSRP